MASVAHGSALPSSLNVGASTLGQQSSSYPAVADLNVPPAGQPSLDGSSLSSPSNPNADGQSLGPSGAVSNQLGDGQQIAMHSQTGVPETMSKSLSTGSGANEYGANYINQQKLPESAGLKAKELSLDNVKAAHKTPNTTVTSQAAKVKTMGNAANQHSPAKHVSSGSSAANNRQYADPAGSKPDSDKPGQTQESSDNAAPAAQVEGTQIASADSATADATTVNDVTAATNYTIKAGDCLWNIARDHLGNAMKWEDIYKLNEQTIGSNPDLIKPGVTIQVPADHALTQVGEASKYVVKSGDNLWDIAKHRLGDGSKWGDLYKLNHEVIGSNPRLIQPGQELDLRPPDQGADQGVVADANASAQAGQQVAQAAPAAPSQSTAPAEFGQPQGATPDAGTVAQNAPLEQVLSKQPDLNLPPSGGAIAQPQPASMQAPQLAPNTQSVGLLGSPVSGSEVSSIPPGAAGAATLPDARAGSIANSPDQSSVVSSSLMTSLQDFLSRKK
jgi:nucleoid-associated protein YgaU